MPYKNDPRRTLTLNLLPAEYAAVAAQAAAACYATPGPYAKARVLGPPAVAAPAAPDPADAAAVAVLTRKLAASEARAQKWTARAKHAEQALKEAQQARAAAEQAVAQAEQALADAPNALFEQYRPYLEGLLRSR